MLTFISPGGNPEVWSVCPDGYLTPEQWAAAPPAPELPVPAIEFVCKHMFRARSTPCGNGLSGFTGLSAV